MGNAKLTEETTDQQTLGHREKAIMAVLGETSGVGLGYSEWNTAQRAEEA